MPLAAAGVTPDLLWSGKARKGPSLRGTSWAGKRVLFYLSYPLPLPAGQLQACRIARGPMERKGQKHSSKVGRESSLDDQGAQLSSEKERAALLASILRRDARGKEARTSGGATGGRALAPRLAGLAVSTGLAVYVWFGSPSWLEPGPPPLPPLAVEETSLRASVWLAAQQVEALETRSGRVPGPQEIGSLPPGIRYERLDAKRYLIVGRGDRALVTHASGDPQDPLLDAARTVLTGGGSP